MRELPTFVSSAIARIPARTRLIAVGFAIAIITASGVNTGFPPRRSQALADSTTVASVFADGQKRIVSTDANTVGDLLQRLDVKLGTDDLVEPGPATKLPDGFFNVNVYRARPVMVVDGARNYQIHTAYQSPRLMAVAAGLTVYPEDTYDTEIVTNFVGDETVGQKVTITRAKPVTITADGHTKNVRTQAETVADLLKQQAIVLGPQDTLSAGLTQPVIPGGSYMVTRVAEVVASVDEVLPRATSTVTDPNTPKGVTSVVKEGADGKRHVTYRIHYHDGKEVARETLGIDGIVKPVAKMVSVGTKVFFGGSVDYWRPYVIAAAADAGVDPNLMLAIMKCESNGNANASNGTHFGLYQYSAATWASYGNSQGTIFDGPTQIRATAGRLSQKNPTAPWLASKSCWSSLY